MQIKDDRNTLLEMREGSGYAPVFSTAERIRMISEEINRKSTARGVTQETAFFSLAGTALLVLGVFIQLTKPGGTTVAFIFAGAGVLVIAIAVSHPRRMRRQIAKLQSEIERIREEGHACPCCSYDLISVPSESDGCTVCPECGGAWCLRSRDGTDGQV